MDEEQYKAVKSQVKEFESEILTVKKKLKSIVDNVEDLDENSSFNDYLENKKILVSIPSEVTNIISEYQKQIKIDTSKDKNLEKKINSLKEKIADYNAELGKNKQSRKLDDTKVLDLEKRFDFLEEDNKKKEEEAQGYKNEIDQIENILEEDEKKASPEQVEAWRRERDNLELDVRTKKMELESLIKRRKMEYEENLRDEAPYYDTQEELNRAVAKAEADLNRMISEANGIIGSYGKKIDELNKKIEYNSKRLSGSEKTAYKKRIEVLENAVESIDGQIKESKKEMEDLDQKIAAAKNSTLETIKLEIDLADANISIADSYSEFYNNTLQQWKNEILDELKKQGGFLSKVKASFKKYTL
jgi:chromosome segregation ATPase